MCSREAKSLEDVVLFSLLNKLFDKTFINKYLLNLVLLILLIPSHNLGYLI